MKIHWGVIAVGISVIVLGLIFHLQGQAIVGPEASFMYSNPDWINYGIQIVIIGSVILVIGILSKIFLES